MYLKISLKISILISLSKKRSVPVQGLTFSQVSQGPSTGIFCVLHDPQLTQKSHQSGSTDSCAVNSVKEIESNGMLTPLLQS
ncbi:hypothetical protein ACRRTK_016719 [Alexandromys fortis]